MGTIIFFLKKQKTKTKHLAFFGSLLELRVEWDKEIRIELWKSTTGSVFHNHETGSLPVNKLEFPHKDIGN